MSEHARKERPRGISIQLHLVLMTGVTILLTSAIFTAVGYNRQRKALLGGIDQKLLTSAQLAREVVGPRYFDRVRKGASPVTEAEFLAIVSRYNKLCLRLGLQYLWSCMVIDDTIVFTTATSPGKNIEKGDHADFLAVHNDPHAFDTVFRTMQPDFSSFRNEWGHGRMVLVPYVDSHGRPYCVGASISVDAVHELVNRTLWRSVGIGFAVLVGALLAAMLMSASLSRPIVRLTRVADSIAHGDMSPTIAAHGSFEIKLLAHSLEAMRDAIQSTMAELREHRDHLEELVRRRTADLERSNRELEQFAYVASHDLREPLRKIKSFTELFARKYAGQVDDQGRRYVGFIVDGAQRMQDLIEALLTYSRIGRQKETWETVDLAAVVAGVLRSVDGTIRESGAEVAVGDLPTVRANASLIGLVFQNLILNAVKFRGEAPPRVAVSSDKQGREWVVCVKDNGIGIDADHRERVFQIFQRLHSQAEYPGTGIGLAICRKIIEDHGGRIWVTSEPDAGSTFCFTLPNVSGGRRSRSRESTKTRRES